MRCRFPAAPWPRSLKLISAVGTAVISAVAIAAYRTIPVATGFTHYFGLGVALTPIAILVAALLLIVTEYEVEGTDLYVGRLLWFTPISLAGLHSVRLEPDACKGSMRVFGNGGLYSFSGIYYSARLGRYRMFATDLSKAVVLAAAGRTVVLTPADPSALIEHLRHRFAGLLAGSPIR